MSTQNVSAGNETKHKFADFIVFENRQKYILEEFWQKP